MGYFLESDGLSDQHVTFTEVNRSSTDYRISFTIINPTDESLFNISSGAFANRIYTFPEGSGERINYRVGATDHIFTWPDKTTYDDEPHTFEIILTGGTLTAKKDGQLSSDNFNSEPLFSGFYEFFKVGSTYSKGSIGQFTYYETANSVETKIYDWDADLSNGTGSVFPESVEDRDGTLNNFATDGSQWAEFVIPASATINAPLQIGAAFSGTYSNFAGTPTSPIGATDGTRTRDQAVTVNSGTEAFDGTWPSLPASGESQPAGTHLFPGSEITLTITDPGA